MTADAVKRRSGRVSLRTAVGGNGSLDTLPALDTSARLDELVANPHNPRDGYVSEALNELAASMVEVGQLQPLAVVAREVWLSHYPDETDAIGSARWVVLTGCRRLAAAAIAGFERLDIIVKDRLAGADPRLSEATLIENLHRENLPPLLEARELAGLVARHGSQHQAAKRIGKTQAWVSQRLALLRLTPEMAELLRAGGLTIKEARAIATSPADEQAAALQEMRTPTPAAEAPPASASAAPKKRRPDRAPAPRDVAEVARELRARYSAEDLARLVALLVG